MRERQKKKKGRTWAEAAKTVLEKYPNTPMSHKEILQVIQRERLKEISGTSPLACLNAMLHSNSRGREGIFYKVPGRMGVYTLKKDIADVVKELSEEASEDSSDNMSDTQCTENNSTTTNSKDGCRGRWKRRVPAKLQSQPSSPQSRCSSPSVSSSKLISPSQKHSKRALKQALKQQQQRNHRRQCGIPTTSSPRLLLKTVKDMTHDSSSSKSSWEPKQTERCPASPHNSTSSSSSSVKADVCHTAGARKVSQHSSRLSARQLRRTKCEIDVETPDSILVNTNLRALINKHTFSLLPTECQQKLLTMLPEVDQQASMDGALKVTSSALNNEFFTSAAQSWKERLAEGDFTPELRLRMRQEIEKEKKVEHWKEHFFESYYGEHSGLSIEESRELTDAADNPEPAKCTVQPDKPEIVKESQKVHQVIEVSHRELRSRDVKTAVTHPSPEEPIKLPAPEHPQLSLETRNEEPEQFIEESSVQKAVGPKLEGEKTLENEIKCKNPTPPLEAVVTCLTIKETQATKIEIPVSEVKQTLTERNRAESPMLAVTSEHLKRKGSSEQETELITEKKPRVTPPDVSSPVTAKETVEQRVPPLKISVLRILSAPAVIEPVSPRTPVPLTPPSIRPGRTGARTLADIKAKAQLARAQRAAAAAAGSSSSRGASSVGRTSTPSPALSFSEEFSPTSSRSQSVSPIKLSSGSPEGTGGLSQTSPSSGFTGHIETGFAQGFSASQVLLKDNSSLMGSQTTPSMLNPTVMDQHSFLSGGGVLTPISQEGKLTVSNAVAQNQRPQQTALSGASMTKTSSSIPTNNPLVTQLLQGKDVPLEKILPKPLAKMEVQSFSISDQDKGNHGTTTVGLKQEDPTNKIDISRFGHHISAGPSTMQVRSAVSGDKLVKSTQDPIFHPLRPKCEPKHTSLSKQPSHFQSYQLGLLDCIQDQSIHLGIFGRKRTSKPAMTGHYLLNVSTYGRGSESSKWPHLSGNKSTAVSKLKPLKKEKMEVEEHVKERAEFDGGTHTSSQEHLNSPRVKVEQKGYCITEPDEVLAPQPCSDIKSESPSQSCLSKKEKVNTRTKETCSRTQLDVCIQGKTEPYQLNDCRQHMYLSQKSHNGQELVIGPQYGGTISMSVPQVLNHSMADTLTSPTVACSGDSDVAGGGMMSFSVTVTAIPAGHLLDQSNQGETSPEQAFIETSGMEDVQSKCYCRLKAMIMCKGCGAFCHDDCIGPSKLCVSCLVVR
ncbi:putative Polycomb group protein ASXL2 isoform X2 [Xyrauchen texanus]|uniref:putative Polycomb group protein ASXL2 isoform X2 n=1 Tax=Xyrauchen texanus TaxID=154827 RepID=UPI00224242B4|nr:putative Polycomb group protein ASXL2 isoform X2 [Xyrauchen texanus]